MHISVEALKGLERKITVSIPSNELEEAINSRYNALSSTAKIKGFRPGKVPLSELKKRFANSVLVEAADQLVKKTLPQALEQNELVPAGMPKIEPEKLENGQDFTYSATFEIYPKIEISPLNGKEIERITADVTDNDVDEMIAKLRDQHKTWNEVNRASQDGDSLEIDFVGYVNGEPFEGGKAENFTVVLGSGSMIPGFESGLIGREKGQEFDLDVTFPEDYGHKELAGKAAQFKITVKKISEGELPALDESFAQKFNINEGGFEALKADIKENMLRELDKRLSSMNRERVFDAFLSANTFDVPAALIDNEIGHLKHEMYHRIFGHEHRANEKIPDFPRELFEAQAKRRVQLGLLFSEFVKANNLTADTTRVDAMIEKLASAYEKPEELRQFYRSSKEHLAEIESLVLEEIVADKISETATVNNKTMSYDDVMSPKKENTSKGE